MVSRRTVILAYTLFVSDHPQRLVLLLGDKESIDRRAEMVTALSTADMPFTPAVVGPGNGFSGISQVAHEIIDLLRIHRPQAVYLCLGHADLIRKLEADGNSYLPEDLPAIERSLHQVVDAVTETNACELVIATVPQISEVASDVVWPSDIEHLNIVIRSVCESRDVLVDRLDMTISESMLKDDGLTLASEGQEAAVKSACTAIGDVLLRAEYSWRKMLKSGEGGNLDGMGRPRHPELP